MKKNKMMRAAGVLLIAVLLTTSLISGTFAKYVTGDTASDEARVAKFGVTIETKGSLFKTEYATDDTTAKNNDSMALSVKSEGALGTSNITNVVAPGTANTEGMTFSITGKPEVAVNVSITIDNDASDIWLGKGLNYPNMTTGEVFNENTEGWSNRQENVIFSPTAAHYYPIKYTLQHATADTEAGWRDAETKATGSLSEIITYLNNLSTGTSTVYAPGTDLTEKFGYYKLTWAWDFDADGANTYDKQDTLLGNLAAQKSNGYNGVNDAIEAIKKASKNVVKPELNEATSNLTTAQDSKYSLEAILNFTITVTQVD